MPRKPMSEHIRRSLKEAADRHAHPWRSHQGKTGCDLSRYKASLEASTGRARNLSPRLKGCYADPIEWAMEEHSELLPIRLGDPGAFESTHHYVNPRDPAAWPKMVKVVTLCRNGHARSFAMTPHEDLSVFPTDVLNP